MHQSIPAVTSASRPPPPPPPPPVDPRSLAFWMANSRRWLGGTFELPNPPGWGRKKRANATSSVNTATFFIDCTVEECHFKHFNVQFFVSVNVFLCNSVIPIIRRLDDTSLWCQFCYKLIDIKINSVKLTAMNSFINMKGCSSNNNKRDLIQ